MMQLPGCGFRIEGLGACRGLLVHFWRFGVSGLSGLVRIDGGERAHKCLEFSFQTGTPYDPKVLHVCFVGRADTVWGACPLTA